MRAAGIHDPAENRLVYHARRLRRRLQSYDSQIRDAYLSTTAEPKLHIGGGWHLINGWLNSDIALIPGVMCFDATNQFPLNDSTFKYIFTEHMIEHVDFDAALDTLRECYRVLKVGGCIRITTPNLASMIGLCGKDLSELQRNYMNWFCKTFVPEHPATPAHTINAMFRFWGHRFIYDESTLSEALRSVGFIKICRYSLMESDHKELRNLEHVNRYPVGLLEFESFALEAQK
jgi:predicted SAM-dependent methyltransferase